jgi:hypothetical protein
MLEKVTGDVDDRTPNEIAMLDSIRISDYQYQLWSYRELRGTFLVLSDAEDAIELAYADHTVRLRKPWEGHHHWLVEILSPAGDRWMTSGLYVIEVYVGRPKGITYYG